MERSEIQSQWEHENSVLQNFRSLFITANFILITLFDYRSLFNKDNMMIIYVFFSLSLLVNIFWFTYQEKIHENVNTWGKEYKKKLTNEIYINLFDNKSKKNRLSIYRIYKYLPIFFISIWFIFLIIYYTN